MEKENIKIDEHVLEQIKQAAYDGAKEGASESSHGDAFKSIGTQITASIMKKIILLGIVIVVAMFGISKLNSMSLSKQFEREKDVEGYDLTLDNNGIWGYTAADFEEAILGDSKNLKRLEVYTQEVSDLAKVTKTGLFNLKAFSKKNCYTYHGYGIFTIDLSKLSKDSIKVDEKTQTVILNIPHAQLTTLDVPFEEMEIGDTEKGLLAIGDLHLSEEDQQKMIAEAKEKMRDKLETEENLSIADKVAEMTVWEMYQPIISKTAPGTTFKIEFEEEVKKETKTDNKTESTKKEDSKKQETKK